MRTVSTASWNCSLHFRLDLPVVAGVRCPEFGKRQEQPSRTESSKQRELAAGQCHTNKTEHGNAQKRHITHTTTYTCLDVRASRTYQDRTAFSSGPTSSHFLTLQPADTSCSQKSCIKTVDCIVGSVVQPMWQRRFARRRASLRCYPGGDGPLLH